jgi:uncharacterized coiled-coil DUF342 family protein
VSAEQIVKGRLSEIEYKRWRMLMNKIDEYEAKRRELQEQLGQLTRESDKLFTEMRKLWEFTK